MPRSRQRKKAVKVALASRVSHVPQLQRNEKAARVLQRFWRLFRVVSTLKLLEGFMINGPSEDKVLEMQFKATVVFNRQEIVKESMRAIIHRFHHLACALFPDLHVQEPVNIKVVLAAYLIIFFPDQLFEEMTDLAKKLIQSAKKFSKVFHGILDALHITKAVAPMHWMFKDFEPALFQYIHDFNTWKKADEKRMVPRVQHALTALYDTYAKLPCGVSRDSPLCKDFISRIEELRMKIVEIGGQEALDAYDKSRSGEIYPKEKQDEQEDKDIQMFENAFRNPPTNETYTHEILLDPNFQLDEDGSAVGVNPLHENIKKSFGESFWLSLNDDLNLEIPAFARIINLLKDYKQFLIKLGVEAGNPSQVESFLDIDFIQDQVDKKTFDYQRGIAILKAVQQEADRYTSDKRKESFKTERDCVYNMVDTCVNSESFCKFLLFIQNQLGYIEIDNANKRFRGISPTIAVHGIEFEREKFQAFLDSGKVTLAYSQVFLLVFIFILILLYQN